MSWNSRVTEVLLTAYNAKNSTAIETQVYEAHAAASAVIFSMIVIFSISFLFCSKNYLRYVILCRTEERVRQTAAAIKGDWAPPKAVRLRDSGNPGSILRSLDSGISWSEVKLPQSAPARVKAAKVLSPDEMYLLDNNGIAFKSVNYGESWSIDPLIDENNFNDLH